MRRESTLITLEVEPTTVELPLVVYRDGGGPWQLVAPRDRRYTFPVSEYRYEVASVYPYGSDLLISTIDDPTTFTIGGYTPSRTTTVRGRIRGLSAGFVFVRGKHARIGDDGGFEIEVSVPGARELVIVEGHGDPRDEWRGERMAVVTFAVDRLVDVDFAEVGVALDMREVQVEGIEEGELVTVDCRHTTPTSTRAILSSTRVAPYRVSTPPLSELGGGMVTKLQVSATTPDRNRSAWGLVTAYRLPEPVGDVRVEARDGTLSFTWPDHPRAGSYAMCLFGKDMLTGWMSARAFEGQLTIPRPPLPSWWRLTAGHDKTIRWSILALERTRQWNDDPRATRFGAWRSGHLRL